MKVKGREIWVADSETDPFDYDIIPKPFIWGLFNGSDYWEFTETDEFVEFVRDREIILYAHNGGKFDWHFLSHHFEPHSPILVIAGRLARFKIGECEFRDSINIYAKPLEAFQKQAFDYNKMYAEVRAEYMPEIREYLESDCRNLYDLVTGFIEQYGLHISTASAAMRYWQYKLPCGRQDIPRSDAHFYDKFKRFFFGGRVQCFERGDITINAKSADINSAYPTAMMHEHPYGLFYIEQDGTPKKGADKWGPMFFDIECLSRGAFGYRGLNGHLYYPDDGVKRIYHVTGWELLCAIETDTVSELKIITHYEFTALRSFAEYITHFWEVRKEFKQAGQIHDSDFAKLMMNSLYGKFAANPERYKETMLIPRAEFYSDYIDNLKDSDNWREFREWIILQRAQDNSEKKYFNLATAASITGYVRAMLWRAICECERPFYCDTDSITAVDFGPSVELGSELGQWEIEYKYDRVIMGGKKLYAFHHRGQSMNNPKAWKLASKGARLTHEDLIKIAAGKTVTYKSIAPTFSVAKSKPTFINRDIKRTAEDSRIVPREHDPMFL